MLDHPPYIEIPFTDKDSASGWDAINAELKEAVRKIDKKKVVIVVECHHGTFEEVNFNALKRGLHPQASCKSSHTFKDKEEILQMIKPFLSKGGIATQYTGLGIEDYFDQNKLEAIQSNINLITEGLVLIYGIGACHLWEADIMVYADMSQWEIQQRFKRHDIDNIGLPNSQYTFNYQYRWAFFNDWPLCNQIRNNVLNSCDYYLETNNWVKPKLVKGNKLRDGLSLAIRQPFRIAPFYDPLLWDENGQVDQEETNFNWCFGCIPDEGNLLFKTKNTLFEVPMLSLIACFPESLLGKAMVQYFGYNFPLYLDFIDTQDTERTNFQLLSSNHNTPYQSEQLFYFLEAEATSEVTIGQFKAKQPRESTTMEITFKTEANRVRPHDYIFVPNGTAIQIGEQVIALMISNVSRKFIRDINPGQYIQNNYNQIELLAKQASKIADASLHHAQIAPRNLSEPQNIPLFDHLEMLNVSQISFLGHLECSSLKNVQIINLIKGDNVEISSREGQFASKKMRYGETFVLPADCGDYLLTAPPQQNDAVAILSLTVNLPQPYFF